MTTGVYIVFVDADIAGEDNVAWCFVDEADADRFAREIKDRVGPAWVQYEPVATSYDDPHFQEYRNERLGLGEETS